MNNKPVAWMDYLEHSDVYDLNVSGRGIPLYTHQYERPHNTVLVPCDKLAEMQAEIETLKAHPVKDLDEQFKKGFKAGKEEGWKAHKFHYPVKELTDEEIEIEWFKVFKPETGIGKNLTNGVYEFALAILRKAQEK